MDIRKELSDDFGPIDRTKLAHIRTLFDETEPLVSQSEYDDPLNPRRLYIYLTTGFDGEGRFDIRWSDYNHYSFHYTEPDIDFRFDSHPNPHSSLTHFHSPPDAKSQTAVRSCIEVERAELVALAVIQRWRAALEQNDPSILNDGDDPP
jgi:hypothetical protein